MKKFISIFVLFCLSAVLFSQQVKNSKREISEKSTFVPQYKIGDEGESGGIVFYVSKEGFPVYDGMGGEKLCHYLEMSKSTLGSPNWCPPSDEYGHCAEVNNLVDEIGYGKANTHKILKSQKGLLLTKDNCAAYMCSLYSTEKTSAGEWFLPSTDELNEIYKAMGKTVVLDAEDKWFWTSSKYSMVWDDILAQNLSEGNIYGFSYNTACCVRAVRAF